MDKFDTKSNLSYLRLLIR